MNEVLQVNEKFSVGFLIRKLLNQFASQVHNSNSTVKIILKVRLQDDYCLFGE